jgi:hypothetical protein
MGVQDTSHDIEAFAECIMALGNVDVDEVGVIARHIKLLCQRLQAGTIEDPIGALLDATVIGGGAV